MRQSLIIVSALVTFGLVGCAGKVPAPAPDEVTETEHRWDVETTDQSISMNASKETQTALGVARWRVSANANGSLDYEATDPNGSLMGRANIAGSEADGKRTLTITYDGAEGALSGTLILSETDDILETKLSELAPVSTWMDAFSTDLEAYREANPMPYKNAVGCVASIVGLSVVALGVVAAATVCIASVSCGVAARVLFAGAGVIGGSPLKESAKTVGGAVVNGVKDLCGIQ